MRGVLKFDFEVTFVRLTKRLISLANHYAVMIVCSTSHLEILLTSVITAHPPNLLFTTILTKNLLYLSFHQVAV